MNMFFLDEDFSKNAEYHADKHVGKILIEVAQMLCCAYHLQGIEAPYKKTHAQHPCSRWVRKSVANFIWTINYGVALHNEFIYRWGKSHKSFEVVEWCRENLNKLKFNTTDLTPMVMAMPVKYHNTKPIKAYRQYYNMEKRHLFKWTKRERPFWIYEKRNILLQYQGPENQNQSI